MTFFSRFLRRRPVRARALEEPAPPQLTQQDLDEWREFVGVLNEQLARADRSSGLHGYASLVREAVIQARVPLAVFLEHHPAPWMDVVPPTAGGSGLGRIVR